MKHAELNKLIKETLQRILKEDNFNIERHASSFISDVLKMGSKDNLFDKYMKQHKIKPELLYDLVEAVTAELMKKWL